MLNFRQDQAVNDKTSAAIRIHRPSFNRFCVTWLAVLMVVGTLLMAPTAGWCQSVNTILKADLEKHVAVLADDQMEGRQGGTRGGRAAGNYLADLLQKRGLKPAGDNGTYFQMFNNQRRNILAYLEGSDPTLRQQFVVLSAHYDHVGLGTRDTSRGPIGYIHNGADDNASGVATVLEIIDAFQADAVKPARSILFAFWDGEEEGLLGSKYWTSTPTVSLDRVVFNVNLDMVGRLRDKGLEIYGARTSESMRQVVSRANMQTDLKLEFDWHMKNNSDHHSFYEKRIPCLMLHTGLHNDYHTPHDDVEKLNYEGMEQVAKLGYTLTKMLADERDPRPFRQACVAETPAARIQYEKPLAPPPPRLGVRWRVVEAPNKGVQLTSVTQGGAAFQAGLQVGDVLLDLNGQPLQSEESFLKQLWNSPSPARIRIRRPGDTTDRSATVQLVGDPLRIGFSWRLDPCEPGGVYLTRVIYGSAAWQAGMRAGDRIYEIATGPFQTEAELLRRLNTVDGPIPVLIERHGRMRRVELDPLPPPRS